MGKFTFYVLIAFAGIWCLQFVYQEPSEFRTEQMTCNRYGILKDLQPDGYWVVGTQVGPFRHSGPIDAVVGNGEFRKLTSEEILAWKDRCE